MKKFSRLLRLLMSQRRQIRRLIKIERMRSEQGPIAWQVAFESTRHLQKKNWELHRRLEEAEKRMERMAVKILTQEFLLKEKPNG